MKEYIEREAVLDTIGVQNNHIWNEVYDLPVADVAPVRHGRWILKRQQAASVIFKCSECGREEVFDSFHRIENTPYCHCGALMDGKETTHG